jgi:hypothetical protein
MKRLNLFVGFLLVAHFASADDFDRLEGPVMQNLAKTPDAKSHDHLTLKDLGNQANILPGIRTPLVLVKTDQGNYARLLVSAGFRKSADEKKELIPILVIDRFDTLDAGPATSRIARGRDTVLFDGFQFDLDTGMVVPEGQGGDIAFTAKGEGGPLLSALKGATLYTLDKSPLKPLAANALTPGRAVKPGDFQGLFQLIADGQWSGRLELVVAGDGSVSGRFRSDQTGGSYKVVGELAPDAPNRITFSVDLPRARLEFDGRLWTDGKGAIAGTVTLLDRAYGFVAIREGGRLAPEGQDVAVANPVGVGTEDAVLMLSPDRASLDGEPVALADFAKRIAEKKVQELVVRAARETSAATVIEYLRLAKEAGVASLQLLSSSDPAIEEK